MIVRLDYSPMYSKGAREKTEWLIKEGEKLPMFDVNTDAEVFIIITQNGHQDTYTIGPCHRCYKTIYLSYDETGLRPQVGWWVLGKTNSWYDNSQNVTNEFIRRVK